MSGQTNEAGDPIEPFNLRNERDMGYFDTNGNFVWKVLLLYACMTSHALCVDVMLAWLFCYVQNVDLGVDDCLVVVAHTLFVFCFLVYRD